MALRHTDHQHDWALTVRDDVNQHWLLPLEGHAMLGTAVLSPDLNHDTPREKLTDVWGVFLAKTTVYF